MKNILPLLMILGCAYLASSKLHAQTLAEHQRPGVRNPILPGYFADPTIKKIGDTYYIYATTDGTGWGAGPSQVWTSKDFLNWTIQPMNWPNTHWYWAPDMTKGYDGRYYLYYSQPVEIFGAVSDTPVGPWTALVPEGKSVIPNYMIPGVITLDAQTFTDDDGKIYMYWGTWGIYPDHGCAVGLLNKDMKSFEKIELIPNTVAKDFFEAPLMFKRNGVYYFMYSSGHCEDHTYRVQYVKSTKGPMGPFEYPAHNPILVTNADGTIHGPGHHSILELDDRYFIVYHRHNNPHSGGGFHRQIAVDEIFFTADGDIKNVVPSHTGVPDLIKQTQYPTDLAFGQPVEASSYYSEEFRPTFALDHNNGTLWRAKENQQAAWISVDLGRSQDVRTVAIEFEYPTYAYQYTIETSEDGISWKIYADQSNNSRWASPVLAQGQTKARYVRLQILNTQLPGLPRGVWNLKVYGERLQQETIWSDPQQMPEKTIQIGNLLHLQAADYQEGQRLGEIQNKGLLAGQLRSDKQVLVKNYQGKKAFFFDGSVSLRSTSTVPTSLEGNSSYSVAMWVNNPTVSRFEQVLAWSKGNQDLTKAIFGVGSDSQRGAVTHGAWPDLGYKEAPSADQWHYVVVTFDGYMERIYVDGKLQKEQNRMLYIRGGDTFTIGSSDAMDNHFSGYLAELKVYNEGLSEQVIRKTYEDQLDQSGFFAIQTEDLDLGAVQQLTNHGAVQADDIQVQAATVSVVGQRTALTVKSIGDPALKQLLSGRSYSLDFDAFDGSRWNHYLLVHRSGTDQLFQNGEMVKSGLIHKLLYVKEGSVQIKSPLHFFNAYALAFSVDQAKERYLIWKEKAKSSLSTYTPALAFSPRYINDNDIFVQLREEKSGLLYLFTAGGKSSGWQEKSYYLFERQFVDKSMQIFAKDEFGNISTVLSTVLPMHKAALLPSVTASDRFMLSDVEIPFWDGYQTSPAIDSTKTIIRLDQGVWTIGSKHTKWGDTNLQAPYIFKACTGDFTIEVQVKDVAGLAGQTRSSSEAGIMIQDAAQASAYINNTILTGWNLGNLARSIGYHRHQEGNNGTGLKFDPYIQIQKTGDYFYVRSSSDGRSWTDLPNTPFKREDLNGKKLKVGLYQIATNNQEGFGVFSDVKIYTQPGI